MARTTTKKKSTTTTTTKTSSLLEAIDHGVATHEVAPYRIRMKAHLKFQIGYPTMDGSGLPNEDDAGKVILDWKGMSRSEALDMFPNAGWVLEDGTQKD